MYCCILCRASCHYEPTKCWCITDTFHLLFTMITTQYFLLVWDFSMAETRLIKVRLWWSWNVSYYKIPVVNQSKQGLFPTKAYEMSQVFFDLLNCRIARTQKTLMGLLVLSVRDNQNIQCVQKLSNVKMARHGSKTFWLKCRCTLGQDFGFRYTDKVSKHFKSTKNIIICLQILCASFC